MQKWVSNNPILLLLLFFPVMLWAGDEQTLLRKADSLYDNRKFAEAQEIYQNLYLQGFYSPATLLKIAFVHEGLGNISEALFYLSEYYNRTEDPKAYEKILILANARNLTGHEFSDLDRLILWLSNRRQQILLLLAACGIFSLVLVVAFVKRKKSGVKWAFSLISLLLISLPVLVVNFVQQPSRAIITKETYLMSGPSSAADFIGSIADGNKVVLLDKKDIWAKIKWNDEEGFVRQADLMINRR